MAIIQYTEKELDTLARLMRAEAIGEGELGMLMVGNVVVNRAIANCLTFKNTPTINDVIFNHLVVLVGLLVIYFIVHLLLKKENLLKEF